MGAPEYDTLVARLAGGAKATQPAEESAAETAPAASESGNELLARKNILLNCKPVSPEEAIRRCGELMVESGYVEEAYIQGMLDREASFSVASGNHVAIPTAPRRQAPDQAQRHGGHDLSGRHFLER